MKLTSLRRGQRARILGIDHAGLRVEALRFGIGAGQCVECVEVIPSGPMIIRKRNQEIAIGRELAEAIRVRLEG